MSASEVYFWTIKNLMVFNVKNIHMYTQSSCLPDTYSAQMWLYYLLNSLLQSTYMLFFFIRTSKFWLSLGLFLIFPIHLLKILAKSQPGCSYKVCSY